MQQTMQQPIQQPVQVPIPVITGDLRCNYQVLDTIITVSSDSAGFFHSADPSKAFDGVKTQLRAKCQQIGGNAVINCQFEYRVALNGKKQVIELFAYGTAVRLL